MTRVVTTLLLLGCIAAPAGADVTIRQTTAGKGLGMSGTVPSTTFIKDLRMRTETVTGDTTRVTNGYDMEIAVPSTMGGPGGPKMTIRLVGPMWVVKEAPGTREYMAFYKAAAESVETGAVADDLFAPPAGYKLNARK